MAETLNKAIKAIGSYAKKHETYYFFVLQKFESNQFYTTGGNPKMHFEAYIDGFGIIANSPDIKGLINAFEITKASLPSPTQPIEPIKLTDQDFDNLPF